MNKVKVFIAMIAVALGGLIIWSCTQDEMENEQATYRYSAEEIATLRAMAEKYGVPEVAFPTKSNQKLPSVEKMQNIFKMLALLKANVSTSIVMTDSTANEVIYKNSNLPIKRIKSLSESVTETPQIAYGTLTWKINWTQSVYNGSYQAPTVSVNASLELSPEMIRQGFHVGASNSYCSIRGTEIYATFECEIMHHSSVTYVLTTSEWFHPGFRPYR